VTCSVVAQANEQAAVRVRVSVCEQGAGAHLSFLSAPVHAVCSKGHFLYLWRDEVPRLALVTVVSERVIVAADAHRPRIVRICLAVGSTTVAGVDAQRTRAVVRRRTSSSVAVKPTATLAAKHPYCSALACVALSWTECTLAVIVAQTVVVATIAKPTEVAFAHAG
jgi:hypothetical protein